MVGTVLKLTITYWVHLCNIPSFILGTVCYNEDSQGDTAKVESKRDSVRAGTEKLERNAQRARYSEPPAAGVPEKKKSVLQAVGKQRQDATTKGVMVSIPRPAEN